MTILDLGCGTGELTKIVAGRFSTAKVLGIDNSAEMLNNSPQQDNLSFINISIEGQLKRGDKWDVIIANGSLQWVEGHHTWLPKIITRLNAGGQLAIQMPSQRENKLNQIL